MTRLTMPTRDYGLMRHFKDRGVTPGGREIDFPAFENILVAARQMVREVAFDICEMPMTTYLCAKAHGKPFTALPVWITRNFHHWAIFIDTAAGISNGKDLEGQTVGVNRGYTVTTGVWARHILASEHGVDLDRVHWSGTDDEHVAEFVPPANADYAFRGRKIADLFAAKEIVAAIGDIGDSPDTVKPLFPDAQAAGFESYRRSGVFPVNHCVVVRDELLANDPGLAEDLFQALTESKRDYLDKLDRGGDLSTEDALTVTLENGVGGDPFPNGVESNRKTLEALVATAHAQHIIPRPFTMEELFAESTLGLEG